MNKELYKKDRESVNCIPLCLFVESESFLSNRYEIVDELISHDEIVERIKHSSFSFNQQSFSLHFVS